MISEHWNLSHNQTWGVFWLFFKHIVYQHITFWLGWYLAMVVAQLSAEIFWCLPWNSLFYWEQIGFSFKLKIVSGCVTITFSFKRWHFIHHHRVGLAEDLSYAHLRTDIKMSAWLRTTLINWPSSSIWYRLGKFNEGLKKRSTLWTAEVKICAALVQCNEEKLQAERLEVVLLLSHPLKNEGCKRYLYTEQNVTKKDDERLNDTCRNLLFKFRSASRAPLQQVWTRRSYGDK